MAQEVKPAHYENLRTMYPGVLEQLEKLGQTVQQAGPLDAKTVHLIQMAAAAAKHSEGSVRSHARRASALGATPEEMRHALVALISTIGFPTVAAALAWLENEL